MSHLELKLRLADPEFQFRGVQHAVVLQQKFQVFRRSDVTAFRLGIKRFQPVVRFEIERITVLVHLLRDVFVVRQPLPVGETHIAEILDPRTENLSQLILRTAILHRIERPQIFQHADVPMQDRLIEKMVLVEFFVFAEIVKGTELFEDIIGGIGKHLPVTLREGGLPRLGEMAVERADDLRQCGINALGKRNVLTLRLAEQTAQFLRIMAGNGLQQIIACDATHKNTFRFVTNIIGTPAGT